MKKINNMNELKYTLLHKLAMYLKSSGDKKQIMIPYAAINDNIDFLLSKPAYPTMTTEDSIEVKVIALKEVETYHWGMPEDMIADLERTKPDVFTETAYYKARELYKLKLSDYIKLWEKKVPSVGEFLIVMEVERV